MHKMLRQNKVQSKLQMLYLRENEEESCNMFKKIHHKVILFLYKYKWIIKRNNGRYWSFQN